VDSPIDVSPRVGRRSRGTFSTDFEIFRQWVDDIVCYFFNSDFKFLDDSSAFSVTSLYVVFILSSTVMLIFLLYNKSSVVAEMGDRLATINIGRIEGGCCAPFRGGELGGPIKHNVAWAEIYPVPPYQVAS